MIDIQHIWSHPTRANGMRQTTPSSKSRTLALPNSVPIRAAFSFRHVAVVCTCKGNLCVTLGVPVSFLAGEVTCCGTCGIEDDLSVFHRTCAFVIIQSIELFLGHCARLHCKTHQILWSARSKSKNSWTCGCVTLYPPNTVGK